MGGVKGYSHCFGYYKNFKFATQAVHNNYGDINETIYDYVVIEYIEEGLNPICKKNGFINLIMKIINMNLYQNRKHLKIYVILD